MNRDGTTRFLYVRPAGRHAVTVHQHSDEWSTLGQTSRCHEVGRTRSSTRRTLREATDRRALARTATPPSHAGDETSFGNDFSRFRREVLRDGRVRAPRYASRVRLDWCANLVRHLQSDWPCSQTTGRPKSAVTLARPSLAVVRRASRGATG